MEHRKFFTDKSRDRNFDKKREIHIKKHSDKKQNNGEVGGRGGDGAKKKRLYTSYPNVRTQFT